jgi:hypothetical protein
MAKRSEDGDVLKLGLDVEFKREGVYSESLQVLAGLVTQQSYHVQVEDTTSMSEEQKLQQKA